MRYLLKILTSRFHLRRAVRVLRAGGLIAYPTEGVFGLGCDPSNPGAIADLLALKHRSPNKGFILIAEAVEQLVGWVTIPPSLTARLNDCWPGPVTWILPTGHKVPTLLRGGHDGLAVRVTAHPVAAALCHEFGGPLVSTSANLGGRRPARSALALHKAFRHDPVLRVPGKLGDSPGPTPIYHGLTGARLR